jgi:hypothetical protein
MFVKNTSCLKVGFNLQDASSRPVEEGCRYKGKAHEANGIDIHISAFA